MSVSEPPFPHLHSWRRTPPCSCCEGTKRIDTGTASGCSQARVGRGFYGHRSDHKTWMIELSAVKLYFIRKIRDYQPGSSSLSRKFPKGQTGKKPLSRDNLCSIFILHVVDNSRNQVVSDFSVPGAALFYPCSVISIRL